MGGMTKNSGYRERNSTADRALDILLLFTDDRLVLSATEIAEELGVARSTTYRYIQSLGSSGFIEEAPGGFRLGQRVFELARLARRGIGLSQLAVPIMRRLATETGEVVLLTRLSGHAIVCLEREEAPGSRIRISYERGQVLPPNAGASAFCILAWLAPKVLNEILDDAPFTRFTPATIVDSEPLKQRLKEIRELGYAVTHAELDDDVLGIGSPILGPDGTVTAGLSVAALAHRVSDERAETLISQVRAAAEEISGALARLDM
ncbi:IclR family transcriptional regulator [Actinomadura scrupuli]|uniref:IclR family transcriptional regulator n=1 Tax=Actinomadura scrupuli TaxID=559629 RepID=UPI003D98BC44